MVRTILAMVAVLALLVLPGCGGGSGDEEGAGELRTPTKSPRAAPGVEQLELSEEPAAPGEEPPPPPEKP